MYLVHINSIEEVPLREIDGLIATTAYGTPLITSDGMMMMMMMMMIRR